MTREADVSAACELGIDALGFVMWPKSPRAVAAAQIASLVKMMPAAVTPVGVFVSPTSDDIAQARDAGIRVLQIHKHGGVMPPGDVWLATTIEEGIERITPDVTIVLDAPDPVRHGGTGRTIDWTRAASIAAARRVMLAGGLTPTNVADAIRQVRPFGVDVASGIEDRPGIKNAQAMKSFVAAVRKADE